MITLKTGVIGSGKTLSAVTEVAQLQARWAKHETEWREVFAFGIRDLALPHKVLQAYPVGGKPGDPVEFDDLGQPKTDVIPMWGTVPAGALVLVDEAHRMFPTSGVGKPAPHVSWLDMSRQAGIDLVLMTQHPRKLHVYARTSVNKHQHYRRAFGGSTAVVYEWDECSLTLQYKSATTRVWRYPKDSFKFYKSADEHTKLSFALPLWVIIPIAGLVAGAVAAPYAFDVLKGVSGGQGIAASPAGLSDVASSVAVSNGRAPLPDEAASQAQRIAGCIDGPDGGFCLDSQGKRVDMPPDVVKWNSRNLGGFVTYDMSPSSRSSGAPPVLSTSPPVAPVAAVAGFSNAGKSYERPNPVRPLTGGLVHGVGTPATASADQDGAVLSDMKHGRL